MSLKRTLLLLTNAFLCLFVLFTVLPVKLNYSSIMIISLSALSIINIILDKEKIFNQKAVFILILTIPFFVYLLGLLNTSNMEYGNKFVIGNLSFLAFPIVFLSLGNYVKKENLSRVYLIGLAITNLYLIYLFCYYFNFGAKFYRIVTLDIYHSTYLGMYNLIDFWLCISNYFKLKDKKFIFFALFFLVCSILTSARIVFLISIISVLFTTFLVIKSKMKRALMVGFIIIVSVTTLLSFPSIKQKFQQIIEIEKVGFDRDNYRSISSRFGKIEASKNLIGKNLWFGTGTGDMIDELVIEYKEMKFVMGYKYRYNPHNQYLDNLVRNGILGGGLSLIVIYFLPFYFGISKKNLLLSTFIFVVACVSVTESILDVHKGITFYAFFSSFILFSLLENQGEKNE